MSEVWEEKVIYENDSLKMIQRKREDKPDEYDLHIRVGNTNTWNFQRFTPEMAEIVSNVWLGCLYTK